jgi:hypothetical protein
MTEFSNDTFKASMPRPAGASLPEQPKGLASRISAQVQGLTSQAAHSAEDLIEAQVDKQTSRGADDLGDVARALRKTSRDLKGNLATPYVDKVAEQVERASDYLRSADLETVMGSAEDYARREPLLFLGGAFALGMVAARFLGSSSRKVTRGS